LRRWTFLHEQPENPEWRRGAGPGCKPQVGGTQSTEVIASEGVELSDPLPPGYERMTRYTAGVTAKAAYPEQATALIELLTSASVGEADVAPASYGFASQNCIAADKQHDEAHGRNLQ
jgi:hypothetical protein